MHEYQIEDVKPLGLSGGMTLNEQNDLSDLNIVGDFLRQQIFIAYLSDLQETAKHLVITFRCG